MISLFAADPSDVYKQCGTVEEIDLVGLFCAEFLATRMDRRFFSARIRLISGGTTSTDVRVVESQENRSQASTAEGKSVEAC
jgi:hypothetical protein